ncbi:hypothetical protein ACFX2H_007617 [Malus domestica]
MWPDLSPFGSILANSFVFNGDLSEGFESPEVLFLVPVLLFQGGAMDLSKVREKILSFVRSATSLGLLPSASDRPEVPVRAAAVVAVARAIASPEVLHRVHGGRVGLYDGFHPRSSREGVVFLHPAKYKDTNNTRHDRLTHQGYYKITGDKREMG